VCDVVYQCQRRVRVINLALNVVELAGSVFQYADLDTVVVHFAKEGELCYHVMLMTKQLEFVAMAGMSQTRSLIIREELTEKCAALLMAYRVQCAAATRLTQVCCGISSKTIVDFDFVFFVFFCFVANYS
jgi:protein transport protein SEC24